MNRGVFSSIQKLFVALRRSSFELRAIFLDSKDVRVVETKILVEFDHFRGFMAINGRASPLMSIKLPLFGLNDLYGAPRECANPIGVLSETIW